MKCEYCGGTGKYINPASKEQFDNLVDREIDKGDFVSIEMAQKRVLDKHRYFLIDCPHCHNNDK